MTISRYWPYKLPYLHSGITFSDTGILLLGEYMLAFFNPISVENFDFSPPFYQTSFDVLLRGFCFQASLNIQA